MKYLRKLTLAAISVIMLASVIIGICIIFAVRNVNVTLLSYSYKADSQEAVLKNGEFKTKILGKIKGSLISFVDEDTVSSAVGSGEYVLESIEKVYPCTVNVVVRERREVFAQQSGEAYRIYDEEGGYLRTDESFLGKADGAPNVIIHGADNDDDVKIIAALCNEFKNKFSSLRSVVEDINLKKAQSRLETDKIIFRMRCGVNIEIHDYGYLSAEKIEAGFNKFTNLSGEQKLGGRIYCYVTGEEQVTATYNPKA